MTLDDYLADRIEPHITWYDRHARSAKRRHVACRIATVVLSGVLTFILILPYFSGIQLIYSVAAGLGSTVLVLHALPLVYDDAERWLRYRQAAEALKQERLLARFGSGPYGGGTDRLQLLVPRAERIISIAHNPLP